MDIALLLLSVMLICCVVFTLIHRPVPSSKPMPTSDNFQPNTGFPGLDAALESYYVDPTAMNEAEVMFQVGYAQGAVECCALEDWGAQSIPEVEDGA